jgi:very-short-patch-repair endonuclease
MAESQAGVISRRQLNRSGLSDFRRKKMLASGMLQEVADGVYRLPGSVRTWEQVCWIALLQCGDSAFLYRRGAARLWNLDGVDRGRIEVAVPATRRPRRVQARRLTTLLEGDLCVEHGFPVTSPCRTLMDLGPVIDASCLERALESALRQKLVDLDLLARRIAGAPMSSVGRLREVLALRPPGCVPTESDAETTFEIIARGLGLPRPMRQYTVILSGRRYRIDFAWPEIRLAVEIDGADVHGPAAFHRDIARQNQIALDGWLILRFGWHALTRETGYVERDLLSAWNVRTTLAGAWRRVGDRQ